MVYDRDSLRSGTSGVDNGHDAGRAIWGRGFEDSPGSGVELRCGLGTARTGGGGDGEGKSRGANGSSLQT